MNLRTILGKREVAGAQDELGALMQSALKEPDEAMAVHTINAANARIEGLRANGMISPEEAQARRRAWTEDYAVARLRNRSPEERLSLLMAVAPAVMAPGAHQDASGTDASRTAAAGSRKGPRNGGERRRGDR